MSIKCENCGQMINDTDKFCKYCGYLLPIIEVEVKETPQTKTNIQDKIIEARATITSEEIASASLFDLSKITVRHLGDRKSIFTKSVVVTVFSILITIGLFIASFVLKYAKINEVLAFCLMLFSTLSVMACFGLGIERYMNTKAISQLSDTQITVRRYGFSKPAEFIISGNIFTLDIANLCDVCHGEILGDLHIERLEKVLIVVCNINRKHYWILDEDALIKGVKDGSIVTTSKKTEKTKAKTTKLDK